MSHPVKYFLCRVKASTRTSGVPFDVLSTHGYVWAEQESQANRMVLDTRTPVLPHPKGRPPSETTLRMVDELVLRLEFPDVLARAKSDVTND